MDYRDVVMVGRKWWLTVDSLGDLAGNIRGCNLDDDSVSSVGVSLSRDSLGWVIGNHMLLVLGTWKRKSKSLLSVLPYPV